MAEAPEIEPVPSSSGNSVLADINDEEGPSSAKKRKTDEKELGEKLEHRLGGILRCAVCLDLPPAAVYQCTNGHLMCAPCFTHLLADARLRDDAATCPICRVEISKTTASRNLAVEKTVSELPSECRFCTRVFPRHSLQHHEEKLCDDRRYRFTQLIVDSAPKRRYLDSLVRIVSSVYALLLTTVRRSYLLSEPPDPSIKRRRYRRVTECRFACIGCPWRGPAHEAHAHEAACTHPRRPAADALEALAERERLAHEHTRVYAQVLELLSYEKITFTDLQLKPYRTEEYLHRLFYESSRFAAFAHQWVVKSFVNKNQRDPTQTNEREISYQLILKSKPTGDLCVQWVVARGPHGEAGVGVRAQVCAHNFVEGAESAPPRPLPLADAHDANCLLANKAIHFRLIMFLSPK